jgi:hypothetical protein
MTELMLCLLVLGNDPSGVPAARAKVVDLQAEQSRGVRQLELTERALRAELAINSRLPATPAKDAAIGRLRRRLTEIEYEIAIRRMTRR